MYSATAVTGIFILLIWLFVFLPIQLTYTNSNSDEEKTAINENFQAIPSPQIGGIIKRNNNPPSSLPIPNYSEENYALEKIKSLEKEKKTSTTPSMENKSNNTNETSSTIPTDTIPVDITN